MGDSWKEDPVIAAVKIGPAKFMDDLLENGHVFMNTASYFEECDAADQRHDPDEGASYCQQATGATLSVQIGDSFEKVGTLTGPIIHKNDELRRANIFCLHSRRRSSFDSVFELGPLGFGDTAVLFLDFNEFIRRLSREAERAGHRVEWGLVDYVDRSAYTGPMGPFRKFSCHSPQDELRIAILPGSGAPLSLRLGSLRDIAKAVPSSGRFKLVPRYGPAP